MAAVKKNTRRNRKAGKVTAKPKVTSAAKKPEFTPPLNLPNVWTLTKRTAHLLWRHKKLLGGIIIVYGVLNLVLVKSLSAGTDVGSLQSQFGSLTHGRFANTSLVLASLIGSVGSGSNANSGVYELVLFFVVSLAIIWALRQAQAGIIVRIRDAYYRGMYPLVPYLLVLLVMALRLLPLVIGVEIYSLVVGNNIAVNVFQTAVVGVLAFGLGLLSLYFATSSLIGLYIVTLPDMMPLQALRSAKELVRGRRWTVLRKILFLPLLLIISICIIMMPTILLLGFMATWLFYVLSLLTLLFAHAYLYTVYRSLLDE